MLDRDILGEFTVIADQLRCLAHVSLIEGEWVDDVLVQLDKLERVRHHLRGAKESE